MRNRHNVNWQILRLPFAVNRERSPAIAKNGGTYDLRVWARVTAGASDPLESSGSVAI